MVYPAMISVYQCVLGAGVRWWLIALVTLEQDDMGLRSMDHVMLPAQTLLNANGTPLSLTHEVVLRQQFCDFLGQNNVAVLGFIVIVFFAVAYLLLVLLDDGLCRILGHVDHESLWSQAFNHLEGKC